MSNYCTSILSKDGFGAQYQRIISTYIYCSMNNIKFTYRPFGYIEHNYNKDINFNKNLENLINLEDELTITKNTELISDLDFGTLVLPFFEKNIDECCNSKYMKKIKTLYWKNKNRDFFKNNKFNIAIHIRRENSCDRGQAGDRVTTSNEYYLNIMNKIRAKYSEREIMFHIYSQGYLEDFSKFISSDTQLYINHDLIETFMGMVAADCLVTSPSSLSYVAALISDGEIYYRKFWHSPRKEWIIS